MQFSPESFSGFLTGFYFGGTVFVPPSVAFWLLNPKKGPEMNPNLTEIAYVLDRSGSMTRMTKAAIAGFNEFLKEQLEMPGEASLSLLLFDNQFLKLHDRVFLEKVKPLTSETYVPQGCTALLDAIGMTIKTLGEQLATLPEEERPGKVIVAIFTDGHENASTDYSFEKILQMITHQRTEYQWEFLFLSADEDAIATAARMGIARENTSRSQFSERGVFSSSRSFSRKVRAMREAAMDLTLQENPDLLKPMDEIVAEEEGRG